MVCRCGCLGRHTFDSIFTVVRWTFTALITGEFPAEDHTGAPWDPDDRRGGKWRQSMKGTRFGFLGVLLYKFGDWSWMKQALGLTGWRAEGVARKVC